jgi:hypothetical protein
MYTHHVYYSQVAADKNTSIEFVHIDKNADDLRAEELRAHSDGSGHLLSDVPLVVDEFENCTLQCLALGKYNVKTVSIK